MRILGTAGHVDHGKSSLVAALTGTNPDRLKEEQAREMTIDLGFASLNLPNGEAVGIVDVPGHQDFISNMLAGIGGVDAVMLVVAADEGPSAQTLEHLQILDLLQISRGLVALTKIDLIQDSDWLDLMELEVADLLQGTSLAGIPLVRVSAHTGEGLDMLVETLQKVLAETPPKRDLDRPRLPVDRVFTLSGFGTIVTGTLLDGSFRTGEDVVCLPSALPARVRGVQTHLRKFQTASPGYRTALNLNGVDKADLHRGDVIAKPGTYQPTTLIDVSCRALADNSHALKHHEAVKVYIGSAEVNARMRLLGKEALDPGGEAFLQLQLEHPVVAVRGDHYIIRLPSPSETLGGGIVLDPHPGKNYRRFDPAMLKRLEQLAGSDKSALVLQVLDKLAVATAPELAKAVGLPLQEIETGMADLLDNGMIMKLTDGARSELVQYASTETWGRWQSALLSAIRQHHARYPLRFGLTREALKTESGLPQARFQLVLEKMLNEGQISNRGVYLSLSSHQVVLTPEQLRQAQPILEQFERSPNAPPDRDALIQSLGEDLADGLIASGRLTQVSDNILFTPSAVQTMRDWVIAHINEKGSLSLAEFRDHFSTSRKYAAAFLEYLDTIGITRRKEDIRVLRIVQ